MRISGYTHKIKKSFTGLLLLSAFLLLLHACKKADHFFDQEKATPQLDLSQQYAYKTSYAVGDTMTLYGRLNPDNGLQIKIGDTLARIVKTGQVNYGTGTVAGQRALDKVQLLITAGMGLGDNRPVTILSGGISLSGPAISIAAASAATTVTDTLEVTDYYTPPDSAVFLYCRNNKGTVYLYNNQTHVIEAVQKDASVATVISLAASVNDGQGNFQVTRFFAGGIDPQENFLYFSAVTTDNNSDNATNYIYRFCKYDLHTNTLTTLNRTALPVDPQLQLPASYQPFEGTIDQVKIIGMNGIYPDSKGNLYLALRIDRLGNGTDFGFSQSYAIASLNAGGALKYIIKEGDPNSSFTPYTWYVDYGVTAGIDALNPMLPGIAEQAVLGAASTVSPDENTLYLTESGQYKFGLFVFDLQAKSITNQVTKLVQNNGTTLNPVFTGTFAATSFYLPLVYQIAAYNLYPHYYMIPLNNQRLLVMGNGDLSANSFQLITEDFNNNRGDYYAPGRVTGMDDNSDTKTTYLSFGDRYVSSGTPYGERQSDAALNMDEDGMMYATAGKYTITASGIVRAATVLVKTRPVKK